MENRTYWIACSMFLVQIVVAQGAGGFTARLKSEAMELTPGTEAIPSEIVVENWSGTATDPLEVKLAVQEETGALEANPRIVVFGSMSVEPERLAKHLAETGKKEYVLGLFWRAQPDAQPGKIKVPIVVRQEGAGEASLTLTINVSVSTPAVTDPRSDEASNSVSGTEIPRLPPFLMAEQAGKFLAKKDYAKAEAYYIQALRAEMKASQWAAGLGDTYAAQSKWDQANKAYQQAVELNPKGPAARNGLGKVLAHEGKQNEAMDQFFEASKLNSNNPEYFINAAESLLALDKRVEARIWARRAIKLGLKEHPIYGKLDLKP